MAAVVLTVGDSLIETFGDVTTGWVDQQGRIEEQADTRVTSPFGLEVTASSTVQVTLTNDGSESLGMFDDWDLIFEVQESPGIDVVYLTYSSTTPPAAGAWAVQGIYLNVASSTAEIVEPGVFNPGEEMVIVANPSPSVVTNTYDRVTLVTPSGIVTKVIVRILPPILYVIDATDGLVYRYEMDGTFLGAESLDAANANAMGITASSSLFWTADLIDDQTYKYTSDFSLSATATLDAFNSDTSGITTDGTSIRVVDASDPKAFKYDMDGVYLSKFSLAAQNKDAVGVATDGTYIWVADVSDALLYKYDLTGTSISELSLTAANTDPTGVTTDGRNIWVVDVVDAAVYKYDMDRAYVNSFSLTAANADPQGIANTPQ